jgi:general stress protein 26
MHDPRSRLDQRFSDPEASATTWDEAQNVLESAQLSWISTVRPDGRPHVTPLVAVWLDGASYFTTGPDEQKAHNVNENSQVVLTTGCNNWDSGLDVVLEGSAQRVTDMALLERLAKAWRAKWDGSWRFTAQTEGFRHDDGGLALVYQVQPSRVLAFAKGNFSQTSYRFDR